MSYHHHFIFPYPSHPEMTEVDEIFALSSRLSERFDGREYESLIARLPTLSPTDGKTLRDKCQAVGTPHALDLLGYCLQFGYGGLKDQVGTVEWYRRSADLGNPWAMANLGACLASEISTAKGENEGIKWIRKSVDLGNPGAMNVLGYCLQHGIGTDVDDKKAVEWYQKSADLGYPRAMNNMGMCFREGTGVPQDERKAKDWFRKARTPSSYWNLADGEEDPLVALDNYCRAWCGYPKMGRDRIECRARIDLLLFPDHGFEVLRHWVHQRDEMATLKVRVQELETRCEALSTELAYRPGGVGFQEAQRDFESLASGLTRSPGPNRDRCRSRDRCPSEGPGRGESSATDGDLLVVPISPPDE